MTAAGALTGTIFGMRLDALDTGTVQLLDELGAGFAWQVCDSRTELRQALASLGRLPAHVREQARTCRETIVREAFAGRSDLSGDEVSAILTQERSSTVVAALLTRELECSVLDELALKGRKAVLDSLLSNYEAVGLGKSQVAVEMVTGYARGLEHEGKLTRTRAASIRGLVQSLDASRIDNLSALPSTVVQVEALMANPQMWISAQREQIIELVNANLLRSLESSAAMARRMGLPVPELSANERLLLEELPAMQRSIARFANLGQLMMSEEERAQAASQEQEMRKERDESALRLEQWTDWAAGSDPVLVKAAVHATHRRGVSEKAREKILDLALRGRVVAAEVILREWDRPVPDALIGRASICDPWQLILLARGQSRGTRSANVERRVLQIARTWRKRELWPACSVKLVREFSDLQKEMSVGGLARLIVDLHPSSYPGLPSSLMSDSGFSTREGRDSLHAWMINTLATVSERTGAGAASVTELAGMILDTGTGTLGEVLAATEEALAA